MARLFNGTGDAMSAAIDLSPFSSASISFWLWWDSHADNFDIAFEFTANAGLNNGGFAYIPNNSGGVAAVYVRGTVDYTGRSFTRPSAGAWHHHVLLLDVGTGGAGAFPAMYVDGVSQTLSSFKTDSQAGTFVNSTLNIMARSGANPSSAGRMAELGIWGNALLSADDANALSKGFSPLMIRPGNLEFYWPLVGRNSPENNLLGTGNGTLVGTTATEHVRVIYPEGPQTGQAPGPTFNPAWARNANQIMNVYQ